MRIKICILSCLLFVVFGKAQTVTQIYKIDGLLKRISNPDTTYVVNFWATWCKPCIQELPAFDSLFAQTKQSTIKIILVSLDFKEELEKKVNPFLKRNQIKSECVLLDEVNGNNFINQISEKWTGAIPATLFKRGKNTEVLEQKLLLSMLGSQLLVFER